MTMIKHDFHAQYLYPNSTLIMPYLSWFEHIDTPSSLHVRPTLDIITAASMSVATSLWTTASACLSDPMATIDRALLMLCEKTPLLWRLKLAALLTMTPREAQHLTERIIMLGGSLLLLWACCMGFRLLTSAFKLVGNVLHANNSPVDTHSDTLERGLTISFLAAEGKGDERDEHLTDGQSSLASLHAPSSPTTEATTSSTPSSAQSWIHEVPQVFLTPPSPTLRQLRYLARKMPASYRMSKLMRPAVGYWLPDYLAAFDEADRTGSKVKLRWRQVREDLSTGRLIVLSEDIKEQFRSAQWEGVEWVDLD